MNRYDPEMNLHDGLGEMIGRSLRERAAVAQPSPEVWQRISQRIQSIEPERHTSHLSALCGWLGHLWHLCAENTISSEAIWSPGWVERSGAAGGLAYRLTAAWDFSWFSIS